MGLSRSYESCREFDGLARVDLCSFFIIFFI
jgi:hypothetical protein